MAYISQHSGDLAHLWREKERSYSGEPISDFGTNLTIELLGTNSLEIVSLHNSPDRNDQYSFCIFFKHLLVQSDKTGTWKTQACTSHSFLARKATSSHHIVN